MRYWPSLSFLIMVHDKQVACRSMTCENTPARSSLRTSPRRHVQIPEVQGRNFSAEHSSRRFIREEMHHIREGKHGARSSKQAIAIGLSKARRTERAYALG